MKHELKAKKWQQKKATQSSPKQLRYLSKPTAQRSTAILSVYALLILVYTA